MAEKKLDQEAFEFAATGDTSTATDPAQKKPKRKQGSKQPKSASNASFETQELRNALAAFNSSKPIPGYEKTVGSVKYGVYAFYDYDGEPIYVGQTRESLGGRISRHLTNQRSDAVAMSVLDPFEVCRVVVYPLVQYQNVKADRADPMFAEAQATLNSLEYTVYKTAIAKSKFGAILNEKQPPESEPLNPLPPHYEGALVSEQVMALRGHPDTRIARRASTIARLSQVIAEREVKGGLRRALVTQANRLFALAKDRADGLGAQPEVGRSDKDDSGE